MRIIMIWNKKGGVGKTTTTMNLACNLSLLGHRVLVFDMDSQSNLTDWFGVKTSESKTIYNLIMEKNKVSLKDTIINVRPNLDLIASEDHLWRTNIYMARFMNKCEGFMLDIINEIKESKQYDYILFDCPPNMSLLHYNTLIASSEIFIPVAMDYLSLKGTTQVYDEVAWIKQEHKHIINITTIIPTFVDRRNRRTDIVIDQLKNVFTNRLTNPIRICTKLAECASFKQSIKEYCPGCNGDEDYDFLTERVIDDNEIYECIAT